MKVTYQCSRCGRTFVARDVIKHEVQHLVYGEHATCDPAIWSEAVTRATALIHEQRCVAKPRDEE